MKRRTPFHRSARLLALCLFLTLAQGACTGASVAVPVSSFPVPQVVPVPLTMGLVLDETLIEYEHVEELEDNGEWRINIGPAQTSMFEQLFSGVFSRHRQVGDYREQPAGVHGIIEPSIEQVQFAIPSQTKTDYFEVWIKYQIKLYDQGSLVSEWPITAYGKANVRNYGLSSTSPALQAAALAACRDAMAFFAVEFRDSTNIKPWLDNKIAPANPAAATPAAATPAPPVSTGENSST